MKNFQGQLMMKKQDILNIWKSYFEKHLNTQFPHDEDALREFEPDTENVTEHIPPITEQEVENSIKRLSNRNAPGIDGITSELIKSGGDMMITILKILFNKIIKTEKSPEDWFKMMITIIHKKGDKLSSENYRAIALL